ncbi:FAD/NAD(P)-binding domain-containing protein [Wolfiporia cocos MD-104 SS10]|uniref:FAD/NAD(P)-binding domain-containing protein n=1 Tax=Wolfiporia cocos (strain MD-104) TaxID=742152 RepID=A0A2H3JFW2_WOLCO|nr:FAD/NAD(P)-binding domain-containing protein [Wolfiporia cocos MD-104 SS10]
MSPGSGVHVNSATYYDVGGGPAGCATALALCRSNPCVSFLLLDDANLTSFKIGESLPADARNVLAYLSPELHARLAHDVTEGRHMRCIGNASAWGTSDLREAHAITNPFGVGLHLNRAHFDQTLRDAVVAAAAGTCAQSTVIQSVFTAIEASGSPEFCGWTVFAKRVSSGDMETYRSKWVIDASGRKACVARKVHTSRVSSRSVYSLGADTVKPDALLAFCMLFREPMTADDEDRDARTVIEAGAAGWWYTAQLPGRCRVVVYHTDSTDLSAKQARTQDSFLELLDQTVHISRVIAEHQYEAIAERPGKVRRPECTAAGSSYLVPPLEDRGTHGWCAVGDAAMAFDPLSSQGMITAMKMGCLVGDAIARRLRQDHQAMDEGEDPISALLNIFARVRSKYDSEKKYYYQQVSRFQGAFWESRKSQANGS